MRQYKPFNKARKAIPAPYIWAGVFALLAIIFFTAFYIIEESMVFTENGVYFELDGETQEISVEVVPDFVKVPELVVETDTGTVEVTDWKTDIDPLAIYAVTLRCGSDMSCLEKYNVNTVILEVKGTDGNLYYGSEVENAPVNPGSEQTKLADICAQLKSDGYKIFAKISVFADTAYAAAHKSEALTDSSGNLWTDRYGAAWVNPYNSASYNEYLNAIIAECSDSGFNGFIFGNASFPYAGNVLDYIVTADTSDARGAAVLAEATTLKSLISDDLPVWFTVDVPSIMTNGLNGITGINIFKLQSYDIGIIPVLTASDSGTLSFPAQEKGKCFKADMNIISGYISTRKSESSDAPNMIPMIELRGNILNVQRLNVMKALFELRGESSDYFAVSLDDIEYFPELFKAPGSSSQTDTETTDGNDTTGTETP